MTVYLFDGSTATCSSIEMGRECLILDGYRTIPFYCVLRIKDGK